MNTPELPEDDDPAAYEQVRYPLEAVAWAELWRIVQLGTGVMDSEEHDVFARTMDVRGVPDPDWRVRAIYAGTRHEPETLRKRRLAEVFELIDRLAKQAGCPNHGIMTDWCGRCPGCGEPLKDSDPTD